MFLLTHTNCNNEQKREEARKKNNFLLENKEQVELFGRLTALEREGGCCDCDASDTSHAQHMQHSTGAHKIEHGNKLYSFFLAQSDLYKNEKKHAQSDDVMVVAVV